METGVKQRKVQPMVLRKSSVVVCVKKGIGRYREIPNAEVPFPSGCVMSKKRCEIEKELNDGLFAHEAEVKYPLWGRHNDPIYKVKIRRPGGRLD